MHSYVGWCPYWGRDLANMNQCCRHWAQHVSTARLGLRCRGTEGISTEGIKVWTVQISWHGMSTWMNMTTWSKRGLQYWVSVGRSVTLTNSLGIFEVPETLKASISLSLGPEVSWQTSWRAGIPAPLFSTHWLNMKDSENHRHGCRCCICWGFRWLRPTGGWSSNSLTLWGS